MGSPEADADNVKTEGEGPQKGNKVSFVQTAAAEASCNENESCKGKNKAAEVGHGRSFFNDEVLKNRGEQGIKVGDES